MKIVYCSDLHLEFIKEEWFLPSTNNINEKESVLVLAGDIALAKDIDTRHKFFSDLSTRFHSVIYIAGNHEYYNSRFENVGVKIQSFISEFTNCYFLNKKNVKITINEDSCTFYGATLWTEIPDHEIGYSTASMNDYRIIKKGGNYRLLPNDTNEEHKETIDYFMKHLPTQPDEKSVIISHHAPSYQSVHLMYLGNRINCNYVTNLEILIQLLKPDLWIHGHCHNESDYGVGMTRVVCNPKGYPTEQTSSNFKLKVVEI